MFVDEWVQKILDAVQIAGQMDKTYIVWTSDHGDGQEDHYHYRKGFPYTSSEKTSGNVFRVGIFLDFIGLAAREPLI